MTSMDPPCHALPDRQGAPPDCFPPETTSYRGFITFEGNRQGMREKKLKSVLIMAETPQFCRFRPKERRAIPVRQPRPTAVVAGTTNRLRALALAAAARHESAGRISLVGFDDREEAVLMDPQLSTVRVQKRDRRNLCEDASRALTSSANGF